MANAGSIGYDVDANTSSLLKAQKQVDTSTSAMVSDFNKVDKSVAKMEKSTKKAGKSLKNFSKNSGQAAIQFQQFAGQIQGGTAFLTAFSQQAADVGIVLGAPLLGAVAGISASLVSLLVPSLMSSSDAVGDFSFNVREMSEDLEALGNLTKSQVSVAISDTNKSLNELSKQADESGDRIASLNQKLDAQEKTSVRFTKTGRAIIETTALTAEETKKLTEELAKEQATLDKINQQYQKESDLLVTLSSNKEGLNEKTSKQVKLTEELNQSLSAQIVALEDGEEAAFRYATAQQLGLSTAEMIPAALDAQISKLFELKEAQDAAAESERLRNQVQFIGLTGEQTQEEKFERDSELLRQARENDLITEQDFLARNEELNRQHQERLNQIREKGTQDAIFSLQQLESASASALTSVITGAQSGSDAIKGLANAILTQMIGALIKLGVQAAIGEAAAVATGTATAASLSAAYATPAALASLASFGANAAPASAGIASTVALSNSLSVAGARENGGPVSAGSMYQVGEGGKPEIFTSGGKNFMIPGDNGRVISNRDAFGGGGTVNNFNFVTDPNVSVEQTGSVQNDTGGTDAEFIIRVVAGDLARQGSRTNKALQSTNTTTSRLGGARRT